MIEGVSTQVTILVHQAFISTKDRFIDAFAIEENENKVLALVGLSMCQFILGGAKRSLGRVNDVELIKAEEAKYKTAEIGTKAFIWGAIASRLHSWKGFPTLKVRKDSLERTKLSALNKKLLM